MDYGYNQIRIGNISTSQTELRDILKAWLAVSAAFGIALSTSVFSTEFYSKFILASFTVGIGFLLHELGHKIVAQKYKCFAEFRSFDRMLLLAIAMSFFGFIFAAPGAVMISGRIDKRKNGIISAAGPAVNIVLALIFLGLAYSGIPAALRGFAMYGFIVNSWLALFNMIPFGFFDGSKILRWNKIAYSAMVVAAGSLMILQYFVYLPK